MAQLRVRLTGENAHFGSVAASDVAKLLTGVEQAVARAAAARLRRVIKETGRREKVIEQAARLRLAGIERGSITPVLELPVPLEGDGTLQVDVPSLSEEAVEMVLADLESPDRYYVSRSLAKLGKSLGIGDRFEALEFEYLRPDAQPRVVRFDLAAQKRLEQRISRRPLPTEGTVVGTLVEADFEKHTARLRSPAGEPVAVEFDPDLDEDIKRALREQAGLEGLLTYDPVELVAREVRVKRITHAHQLTAGLDPHAFWRFESLEELARHQGVPFAAFDPDEIFDAEATETERQAFQEALSDGDA